MAGHACDDDCARPRRKRRRFRWLSWRKEPGIAHIVLSEPEADGTLILAIHKGRKRAAAVLYAAEAQRLSDALARWARANGGG